MDELNAGATPSTESTVSTTTEATSAPATAAPASTEPAAPVSRRETIERAMQAKVAPPAPSAAVEQPAKTPAQHEAKPADTRPRDDAGRFKALPKSWRKELAPKYEALDPDIQAEVHRREEDIFKGIEQYKSKAEAAQSFEAVMQPYMPTIQQLGITPQAAVGALMSADHKLRFGTDAQKVAVISELIQNYRVPFDPANPPAQADPTQQEIARLNDELRSLKQAQEQASLTPYVNAVNAFRTAHEHYDQLEPQMLALIQAGAAKDLDQAYEQALFAHPELRQQALAKQREADQAAEAERVRAARAAAVQVRGAPSQAIPQQTNVQDRRAVIKQAMAGLQR